MNHHFKAEGAGCLFLLLVMLFCFILGMLIPDCAFGIRPVHPISARWTMGVPDPDHPEVPYLDHVEITIRSEEDAAVWQNLWYQYVTGIWSSFRPPSYTSLWANQNSSTIFPVPSNTQCPCTYCITQLCQDGIPWSQCGYIVRPGQTPPPGYWTPFMMFDLYATPCQHIQPLLKDGFETGLKPWGGKYP